MQIFKKRKTEKTDSKKSKVWEKQTIAKWGLTVIIQPKTNKNV